MNSSSDRPRSPVDPEILKAVSTLTVKVQRVVEGLQGGAHASPHLGASVEFAEHKKYSPGDDIRHIDWRALARTDRYFVKQHQREVVLRCLMTLDCSASMGYRGKRARSSKLGYAVELLAALAHILVRQGDAAGLLTFDSHTVHFIPPRRRPDHLSALMTLFASLQPAEGGGTGFLEAIGDAADHAGRRAMVVLASDLWGAGRETEITLAQLAVRGHDVVIFHVLDEDEIDLPFDHPLTLQGMEDEPEVEVDPTLVRQAYRREINAVQERWRRVCGEAGIDLVTALTSSSPLLVLSDFVARRHERSVKI
ncbi:MAG: DUF58 domain-containing protein [Proteobacteria bacterium]|nr:DUF58 domain-containing protein [Pseudomonadota bacterium]